MTFKPARLLVALLSIAVLPVFAASTVSAQNVATVNGKGIPSYRADYLTKVWIKQSQGQYQDTPELREKIKQKLVDSEVLAQEADKLGLGKSADFKTELEFNRQQMVISALVNDFIKKNPVSDSEVKAEYDRIKTEAGDKEYHVRHILVDKEEDAKAIIAKLKGGAKFDDLAKQSKDAGSADKGGDLNWITPNQFWPSFSTAFVALKKGEMTDTPVKTEDGFHVIKLDDVRTLVFPPLETARAKVTEMIQQKKLSAYHDSLVKKAKIQ